MLKGRCLECGLPGRMAKSCSACAAKAKPSLPTPPVAKAQTPSVSALLPCAQSVPASVAQNLLAPKAASALAPLDLDARAEAWFAKNPQLVFSASGWTAFKPVLVALGVASGNPRRYLDKKSDSPKLLWKVARRMPRDGIDFKQAARKHDGHQPLHVRRAFLKEVLKERYPQQLPGFPSVHHGALVSFSLVFANIRQFAECGRAANVLTVR